MYPGVCGCKWCIFISLKVKRSERGRWVATRVALSSPRILASWHPRISHLISFSFSFWFRLSLFPPRIPFFFLCFAACQGCHSTAQQNDWHNGVHGPTSVFHVPFSSCHGYYECGLRTEDRGPRRTPDPGPWPCRVPPRKALQVESRNESCFPGRQPYVIYVYIYICV